MTYYYECRAVKRKKDESKLKSAEMRMLRLARGKTRLDHIRNEDIGTEAHIDRLKPVGIFLENNRINRIGHCCAKSLKVEVSGRRSRSEGRI